MYHYIIGPSNRRRITKGNEQGGMRAPVMRSVTIGAHIAQLTIPLADTVFRASSLAC
jgi:hypothetical protein